MMKTIVTHLGILVYTAFLMLAPTRAHAATIADESSAVVFVYQRIGEDTQPQSSISQEQFAEHIKELQTGGYNVLPLDKIVNAAKNGDKLPPKTVGITFDGAYSATLDIAVPLLQEAKMPFTVFYASEMANGSIPSHMTWDDLQKLRKNKLATLGILPSYYDHMVNKTSAQNAAAINKAIADYREHFDEAPVFFAYPYGEYSAETRKQMENYNFTAVFGQQSGVIYKGADFLALPRFTMTDAFGDLDRFRLTANALPLPVSDVTPESSIITQNPPAIGFTVSSELEKLDKLHCFISGIGKVETAKLSGNRIEIRLKEEFEDRRTRINCTLPDERVIPGELPRWRWFGTLFINPDYSEDAAPDAVTEDQ